MFVRRFVSLNFSFSWSLHEKKMNAGKHKKKKTMERKEKKEKKRKGKN
jgi:hypothetical protein